MGTVNVSKNFILRTHKAVKNVMWLKCHIANRNLYEGDWMKCQKQMVSELIQSPGFHPESWESEWFETHELRSY